MRKKSGIPDARYDPEDEAQWREVNLRQVRLGEPLGYECPAGMVQREKSFAGGAVQNTSCMAATPGNRRRTERGRAIFNRQYSGSLIQLK